MTDYIVLPRAEVEALLEKHAPYAALEPFVDDVLDDLEALLSEARPVADAGVWSVLPNDDFPDDRTLAASDESLSLPLGPHRVLLAPVEDGGR